MAQRGRRRIDSNHVLTPTERSRRWRERHPKPPKPREPEGPPELKTFSEIAASLLPEPPKKPASVAFDPAAMISIADPVLPTPDPGFGFLPE